MKSYTVLGVEDREDDIVLLRYAFRKSDTSFTLEIAHDGQEAVEYLDNCGDAPGKEGGPLPDLVLLDLKMPRRDGFAVLDWIHGRNSLEKLPPLAVFSSSQNEDDVNRAYQKGADWFFVKPVELDELMGLVGNLKQWIVSGDTAHLMESPYYRPRSGKENSPPG